VEDHIKCGTYRPDRHGDLPKSLLKLKRKLAADSSASGGIPGANERLAVNNFGMTPGHVDMAGHQGGTPVGARGQNGPLADTRDQGMPQCPEWLDEIAKREWQRVCEHLKAMGTLPITDKSVIECYCAAYSRWQKAEEKVLKPDECYNSKFLAIAQQAAKDALNQVRAYQNDLGLTPKSVVVAPKQEGNQSEMDKFLDQQAKKLTT
jgi:P27 family predicted phage terminase small subunit